jgi:hypothetical protein
MRILISHVSSQPPDLRALVSTWLPPELERVIAACLAKAPADRPHDARALGAALRAIPIPPEHVWANAAAQDWWAAHHPRRRTIRPASDARELAVLDTAP